MLCALAEAPSGVSEASKMELCAGILNFLQINDANHFWKKFHRRFLKDSDYTFDLF